MIKSKNHLNRPNSPFAENYYSNPPEILQMEHQIGSALERVKMNYSCLLSNLLSVMLCHPNDRPLPSQIYEVFAPYSKEIRSFKPFQYSAGQTGQLRNSIASKNRDNTNGNGKVCVTLRNMNASQASSICKTNNVANQSRMQADPMPNNPCTSNINSSMCASLDKRVPTSILRSSDYRIQAEPLKREMMRNNS
jgi:hypothetical protein